MKTKSKRRWFAVVLMVCLILAIAMAPGKGRSLPKAKADSSNAYPSVCLGGWQNPQNAAGTPDVQPGGTNFLNTNSAVLNGESAQLFCGNFAADDQSITPAGVILHLSWNVTFPNDTSTSTDENNWSSVINGTTTETSGSGSSDTSTDTGSTGTISSTTPAIIATTTDQSSDTISSTTPAIIATTTDQSSDTSDNATTTPPAATSTTDNSDNNSAGATPPSTQTVTPPPPDQTNNDTTPPPNTTTPPDDTSSNGGGTSLIDSLWQKSLSLIMPTTFADTNDTSTDVTSTNESMTSDTSTDNTTLGGANFLDVTYSLDGQTWQELGQVNANNWQNFSVTIPVTSWDDISKLQIQLNPIPSVDEPTIMVDGMWLEVDDSNSFASALQNAASGALDAISNLSNTVDNALNDTTNAIANALDAILPGNATSTTDNAPDTSNSAVSTTPPPPLHQYTFSVGSTIDDKNAGVPTWVPADQVKSYAAKASALSASSATVSLTNGNAITVTGTCGESYYTILIFANQTDYTNNLSGALFDQTYACSGGTISQTIDDTGFPHLLTAGTYYLMVADQDRQGLWEIRPALYPVIVNPTDGSSTTTDATDTDTTDTNATGTTDTTTTSTATSTR